MLSCSAIAQLFALTVLLGSLFTANALLTTREQDALGQILRNHPALSSVPLWETVGGSSYFPSPNDPTGEYYGRSWNTSFENLCQNDGFDIYGVYCVGGHVGGLRVTQYWGLSLDSDYSAVEGLDYLTNFTDKSYSRQSVDLLSALSASLPLAHVETGLLLPNFSYPDSLVYLSGRIPANYSFANMSNLQTLVVTLDDGFRVDLTPLCESSLIEVDISYSNFSRFVDLVNCAPYLQRATADSYATFYTYNHINDLNSSSLTYLNFYIGSVSANRGFNIECPALEELHLSAIGYWGINITAPNLKSLDITGTLPTSFSTFVKLEELSWGFSGASTMPNLTFAPNLRAIGLSSMSFGVSNINDIWAAFPTTIESLQLSNLANSGQISFPSTWTSLKTLNLSFLRYVSVNVNSLLSLSNLEILSIFSSGNVVPSLEHFYRLPNLKQLSYYGATAVMQFPPDFLVRMKNLTSLDITCSGLTGAVPWRGWEGLESFAVQAPVTTWPTIEGSASSLISLSIASDKLIMLPTDASLRAANFQKLRRLVVSSTKLKTMPFFWTDLPKINHVVLKMGEYSGPFQTPISAPRLASLSVTGLSLCGSLPTFVGTTHLNGLTLKDNDFSGSIPPSWEDNLSILGLLDLSNNTLNGSIPSHLLDHHGAIGTSIILQSNGFTGPLWNMSAGKPDKLQISNTGLDICAQDPEIRNSSGSLTCAFDTLLQCPSRCATFWTSCLPQPIICAERSYVARPTVTCRMPIESCPLPQPSQGFECNGGIWIFIGTPTNETLTLPPSAGAVYVFGNLSTNGTITFSGTETSLEIQGCVLENPTQIVIELPSESTPSNTTLLTQYGKNCGTDLSKVPVVLVSPKDDCKKTTVSSSSTLSSLAVVFTVEDTCHKSTSSKTKWIILGSTVGGVLVLLWVVIMVLYFNSPVFRSFVRTCSIQKSLSSR